MKKTITFFSTRAAMMLLATLLLTLTAQTAWADDNFTVTTNENVTTGYATLSEAIAAANANGSTLTINAGGTYDANGEIYGNLIINTSGEVILNVQDLSVQGNIVSSGGNLNLIVSGNLTATDITATDIQEVTLTMNSGTIQAQNLNVTTLTMNNGNINANDINAAIYMHDGEINARSFSARGEISGGTIIVTGTFTAGYLDKLTISGGTIDCGNFYIRDFTIDASTVGRRITANSYQIEGDSNLSIVNGNVSDGTNVYVNGDGAGLKNYLQSSGRTTLTAVEIYTVSFYANGGEGSMSNQTFIIGVEQALSNCEFTRTGYTFAGWATDADGDVAYTNGASVSNLTTTADATVTLFAKWTPITYTVTFNANGGDGNPMANQAFTYDVAQDLSACTYTRTGYTFAGWATTPDGAMTYNDEESVNNLTTTADATVTLYAKWTANTYTVTLDRQGGGGQESVTATYGSDMHPLNPVPSRIGYEFVGYYTEVNGGGVKYYNANGMGARTWGIDANTTLYAYWKKDLSNSDITIEIPAQPYNGSELTPDVIVKDNGSEVSDEHYTITLPEGRTNAGDYTIEIHAKEGSTEYVGETGATFIISRKAVTITAGSDSRTYDGTALNKNTFTATPLESGDTHTFTVEMTSESTITDVGTQPNVIAKVDGVAVETGEETIVGNYLVTTVNGTLTINPITENVTVTITEHSNSDEIVYNGQEHTVTGYDVTSISNTLYTEADFTFSGNAEVKGTNAGTYPMELMPEDFTNTNQNFSNVTFNVIDGALTIDKAPLTVTANDRSIFYGNAAANDGVTYSGFVNNEDENVLGGELTYAYSNANGAYGEGNDAPGEYDIKPSGLTSGNYAITFVPGKLTVNSFIVKVSVVDKADGKPIVGNQVVVQNSKGVIEHEWNSTEDNHEISVLKAGGEYTIMGHAYIGYTNSAIYTLTIDENGNVSYYSGTITQDGVLLVENPFTVPLFAANSSNLWMTWCDKYDYVKPEGVTVYTVSGVENNTVTLEEVSDVIPAYTPVLLYREAAGDDVVTATFSALGTAPASGYDSSSGIVEANLSDNVTLYGNSGDEAYASGSDNNIYAISDLSDIQSYVLLDGQFVLVDYDEGISAHRCWLNVTKSTTNGARLLSINTGGENTGIETTNFTNSANSSGAWYGIDGRKLDGKPTKKGLYIYNGKKQVIK